MVKKGISPLGVILIVAVLIAAGTLFLFPYEPLSPPVADDTGFTQEGIQEVVNSNNQFAFDFYSEIIEAEEGNVFFSPYSIYAAVAMTYEGARGETAEEIKSVFYFPDFEILRPNFAAIYNKINLPSEDYEMRAGNALWVQQDYPLLEEYVNAVESFYGGKATGVDFIRETERSRLTINSFIEKQTNNRIKDLIPEGGVNPMTRLVITNAVYFKGTWLWQFEKSDTRDMEFWITSENSVEVPMMYMKPDEARFNYVDLEELQILEMPYKGEDVSMLILLPTETIESIEFSLNAEMLEEYKSQMQETKLDSIYLPKFEFDAKYSLKNIFESMGMSTAFVPGEADLSGIDGTMELYIDSVIHQAFIRVDEEGTEAAAATAIMIGTTAWVPRNDFIADRPFMFIIQETQTGNILFMGKIMNPLL